LDLFAKVDDVALQEVNGVDPEGGASGVDPNGGVVVLMFMKYLLIMKQCIFLIFKWTLTLTRWWPTNGCVESHNTYRNHGRSVPDNC
jgi:hypothetical protein